MIHTYTVSFFGHRRIENAIEIEGKLEKLIVSLLRENTFVEFLVGRDGEFDLLVASVIRRCKRQIRNDNSSLVWVMPYPKADFLDNEENYRNYYDEIEVCANAQDHHYKSAFHLRNNEMIDRSNLIVCCVQHSSAGAWKAMKYAQKLRKNIVNLNDPPGTIA